MSAIVTSTQLHSALRGLTPFVANMNQHSKEKPVGSCPSRPKKHEIETSTRVFASRSAQRVRFATKHVVVPEKFDVLLGRGRSHVHNPGNRRLLILVNINKGRYNASNSRIEKTQITQDIVNQIKNCGTETGRFLRPDDRTGEWVEIDDDSARLKVSQALRYIRRAAPKDTMGDEMVFDDDLVEPKTPSDQKPKDVARSSFKLDIKSHYCNAHQQTNRDSDNEPLVSDEEILMSIGYGQPNAKTKR